MTQVNIHEAKTHLSRLVEEVSGGAEVVIAKEGKPVARLVPMVPAKRVRKLGMLKGKLRVPDDFDAPLAAKVIASFEGH